MHTFRLVLSSARWQ